ncbi:MAG: hypothetical protein GKR95_24890 [Gammaproteobacteria bacterium]|nr:hypothetical protein [Gammaproteobacteria bacterium]NKB65197.1 hypothetical protein [Gammaproteobacteria bacterium]
MKGGNSDWARGIATLLIVPLFMLNWKSIYDDHTSSLQSIWPWLLVWGAVTAVVIFQLIPGLGSLLGIPSIGCYEWLDCESRRISSFPKATVTHWSMFTVYWMVVWLVSRMASSHIRLLAFFIAALAIFQATYGIAVFSLGQETIFGIWPKEYYLSNTTGTFVNRNHFSGFIELTWPLVLSVVMLPRHRQGFDIAIGWRYLIALVISCLFTFAILGSQSRLGSISAIVGILGWVILMKRRNSTGVSGLRKFAAIGVVPMVILGALWFGVDSLLYRFVNHGFSDRAQVWQSLFELPSTIWLTGIGAGTFIDFFRHIQTPNLKLLYEFAHSDILEFILDYGIVGTVFILVAAIRWLRYWFPSHPNRLAIGALSGVLAIVVHSTGDFNLHIPGVAVVFWVSLGIGVNSSGGLSVSKRVSTSV